MIDFHSHLLPCIDDGSRSVEMSLDMLRMWRNQGITKIVATPHFYADKDDPERFIAKRTVAYQRLCNAVSKAPDGESLPHLLLGSEVHFFNGIGFSSKINTLCVGSTRLILVEMPFSKWTDRMFYDIEELIGRGYIPVMAHVERYDNFFNRKLIRELKSMDIYVQANAEYFLDRKTQKKALKELESGEITFLGSDAHNLDVRSPNLGQALTVISNNLGGDFVPELIERQNKIIMDSATFY